VWSHLNGPCNLAKRNIGQLTVLIKTGSGGCSTRPLSTVSRQHGLD